MKNFLSKILPAILLVFSAGILVQAQSPSIKILIGEIQSVQTQLVPDKRVAVFDVTLGDTVQSIITVNGETNLPEGKSKILQLLKTKGIPFTDSIQVLPNASLGDKIWGLGTLSVTNMRSLPSHASELVSQALMGTPLKVLDSSDGWFQVQTPDYYIGWMEGNGLTLFSEIEMNRWRKSDRCVFNRISGNAFASVKRKSMVVTDLVLGDILEVEAESRRFWKIRIPDGRIGFVRKKDCLSWSEWTNQKPDVQAMIAVAKQLLGVPYTWGGTSSKTVDCSGLTKTVYFSQGIILARDASQQARYGEHPDFNEIANLQPGDLLFFGRNAQRITHVGMYMGNGKYIHSSGLVRINSLDPDDPAFNVTARKSLVSSSRILNSLNTEGIVPVKDHPWY